MLTRLPRVSIAQLRTLLSTTGGACRRDLESSHRPYGKTAHALALTLACTTAANAPVNYRLYVPQRPSKVPIAWLTCAQINSHLSFWIDIWFYQGHVRASHACKLPIALMGFSHILRVCLQGGGVYVGGGTVTFSSCTITGNTATGYVRAHVRKFPSPRWEMPC